MHYAIFLDGLQELGMFFPFIVKSSLYATFFSPPPQKKGLYISYMQHLINNKILYATITDFQFMNSQLIF